MHFLLWETVVMTVQKRNYIAFYPEGGVSGQQRQEQPD